MTGPSPSPGEIVAESEGPQAFLVEYSGPGEIKPHFHPIDQFQVVVRGSGTIGTHPVSPIAVHYTDGFTPYGPIRWTSEQFAFFNFRAVPDSGAFYMPESRDELRPRKAGRNLQWQTTEGYVGGEVAGISADDGLLVERSSVLPGGIRLGRSPAGGGGQFFIVVAGKVRVRRMELGPLGCIHVAPDDPPVSLVASAEGAELLCVQFPRKPLPA